jgi:hypothetical protein
MRPPRAVVALDEAFTAARPALAARLENPAAFGEGPAGMFGSPLVVHIAMSEGAGKALDAARAEHDRSGKPVVLVASPLIAKAILKAGTWSGDPPLLVPEWKGDALPGLWYATTDPAPAYEAAGAVAGAFVAAIAEAGGTPSCGLVYSEAPSRPRTALAAFEAAFAKASEGRPLQIRELDEGMPKSTEKNSRKTALPTPASAAAAAETAVKELLGYDIRVLFVALGPASGAAIRSAARPGLAIGSDFPYPEPPKSLAFRISPDDVALAQGLDRDRRSLRFGGIGAKNGPMEVAVQGYGMVPALLVEGPAAREIPVGQLNFASLLSKTVGQWQKTGKSRPGATLRAKGSPYRH